jgi:hypothetical protein
VAATACESDSNTLVKCQVLGQQRQALHTELLPDELYAGGDAQLTISPKLVTGVPGDDSARVVGIDFEFPLPDQVDFARATIASGGNILGRASVEDRLVRLRYAGGTATLGDLAVPRAQIQAFLTPGSAGTDLVWRVPTRIEVTIEWHGTLGFDTCTPVDPSAGLISAPIKAWTPGTFPPGSYPPGSYPPGTYPPGTYPGPVVIAVPGPGPTYPNQPPPAPVTSTTTHAAHGEAEPPG